ncbi:MAG: VaFE repeat-containing surface-anchored protein [Propionibacteriaceae bacterium]|nr:VaFE repeat-containing surface-anchored protein [Propionibacteriaceae bacterium]
MRHFQGRRAVLAIGLAFALTVSGGAAAQAVEQNTNLRDINDSAVGAPDMMKGYWYRNTVTNVGFSMASFVPSSTLEGIAFCRDYLGSGPISAYGGLPSNYGYVKSSPLLAYTIWENGADATRTTYAALAFMVHDTAGIEVGGKGDFRTWLNSNFDTTNANDLASGGAQIDALRWTVDYWNTNNASKAGPYTMDASLAWDDGKAKLTYTVKSANGTAFTNSRVQVTATVTGGTFEGGGTTATKNVGDAFPKITATPGAKVSVSLSSTNLPPTTVRSDKDFSVVHTSGAVQAVLKLGTDYSTASAKASLDPLVSIGTTAKDKADGDQFAPAGPVELVDTVSYKNLTVGTTYKLVGTLMDKATGLAVPGITPVEASFTPTTADGTANVTFKFDASKLGGKTLVVFEKLYLGSTLVASHEDISDEGQSIRIVELGTTATDKSDGDKYLSGDDVQIADVVAYKGLKPGLTYTVTGTLYDKATGKPIDGITPVTTTFTAKQADGTVELVFAVKAELVRGKVIVAFESVSYAGLEVGVHADIEDEAQTVYFPNIGTTATDKSDGDHKVTTAVVTVVDEVAYTGLVPGKEYTLVGVLMDKASDQPLVVDGNEIRAEAKFTPTTPDGTASVEFSFDASELDGRTLVVFEQVLDGKVLVAEHANLEDAGQSVVVEKPAPPNTPQEPLVENPDEPTNPVVEEPETDAPEVEDLPVTGGDPSGTVSAALALMLLGSGLLLRRRNRD